MYLLWRLQGSKHFLMRNTNGVTETLHGVQQCCWDSHISAVWRLVIPLNHVRGIWDHYRTSSYSACSGMWKIVLALHSGNCCHVCQITAHFWEGLSIAALSPAFWSLVLSIGTSRQKWYLQMRQTRFLVEVKWHQCNWWILAAVVGGSSVFMWLFYKWPS